MRAHRERRMGHHCHLPLAGRVRLFWAAAPALHELVFEEATDTTVPELMLAARGFAQLRRLELPRSVSTAAFPLRTVAQPFLTCVQ
jgi:hypothetical protein